MKKYETDIKNRYITEYYIDGILYGDEVAAESWEDAQKICNERGRGERVIGELVMIIPYSFN